LIKIGIIGTGLIAHEHAQAIAAISPQAQLVAATDISAERLGAFSRAYRISRVYSSAAELIADAQVQLVVVATPPAFHEDAVVSALTAGKYVLCEKPLAHCLASADRIAAAEARHPGRLSVSYQMRYAPQYRRMLWLIQNGWIGDVQSAIVERHGYIPHTENSGTGWWGAWDIAGGGVLITQLIHEIDILLLAMGEPHQVQARMDTRHTSIESEDWIEADLKFAGTRTAHVAASVNSGQMRGQLKIVGRLGSISPQKLELKDPVRHGEAIRAVDLALPDTTPLSAALLARAIRKLAGPLGQAVSPTLAPHALLHKDICMHILNGSPLPIPTVEAAKSLRLCSAAYESGLTGNQVDPRAPTATYDGITKARYDARARPPAARFKQSKALPISKVVRVGLIGLDTTHAATFTDLLHNPYNSDHIPGAKVVAAWPGGSSDMHISASRVQGITTELREKYRVPIVDTVESVADASDLVFILSCDGRTHPGLFQSIANHGKPVFVDKPFAITTQGAKMIYSIAKEYGTQVFSSSAFRYADNLISALTDIRESGETIKACRVHYWGQIQPTQGRFFWYGIHAAELLLAVMGKGVAAVEATTEGDKDVIKVWHRDGRFSSMVGALNDGAFRVHVETDKREIDIDIDGPISARILATALDVLTPGGYPRLWSASSAGSVSGRPSRPFDPDAAETMEIINLLEAAQRSHADQRKLFL
jgi:predicted dehydrogenase